MHKQTKELLSQIRRAPSMYLGDPPDPTDQMVYLSILLHGYHLGLCANGYSEQPFLSAYASYLKNRLGWSMSCGPIDAILRNTESPEAAWAHLWETLEEFYEHISNSK